MDFGSINASGSLAKELVKVLGTTTQALDKLDGKKDGKISVTKIQERFSSRVAALPLSGRNCCDVPAIMFVDNNNGVIDGEDVFIAQQETINGYDSWGGRLVNFSSGYESDKGQWMAEVNPIIERYRELLPQMSRWGITRFSQLNEETMGDLLEAVHPGRNCDCGPDVD